MFLANSAGTLMFLSGCSNETTNLVPAAPTPDVSLATTAFGQVLTGANGKTLYFFASDVQGKSECTGNCTTNWPAYTKENPTLGAGLVASDFSTITKADGSKQTLYKGWPLYYYVGDTKAGDTNGEKIGNVWFVAKTKYSIFYANTQLVGNDGKNYLGDYTPGDGKTVYLIDAADRILYGFMNDKKIPMLIPKLISATIQLGQLLSLTFPQIYQAIYLHQTFQRLMFLEKNNWFSEVIRFTTLVLTMHKRERTKVSAYQNQVSGQFIILRLPLYNLL
jgi:predicted lipoprotein with Yx(FWY)xxD motif